MEAKGGARDSNLQPLFHLVVGESLHDAEDGLHERRHVDEVHRLRTRRKRVLQSPPVYWRARVRLPVITDPYYLL